MFKFNFFKFKGKGGVIGLLEVFIFGFKGDLKSLKVSLGFLEGEVEVEVFLLKGKFFLFKSKKLWYCLNLFSDEREFFGFFILMGILEFEGGEVLLEGGKVKGKYGKLKFGIFGGLGLKSKGYYEVIGSDDEIGKL